MFGPVALTIVFALVQLAAAVADRGAGARLLAAQARRAMPTSPGWSQAAALYTPLLESALAHAPRGDDRRWRPGCWPAGAYPCSARPSCRPWTRATSSCSWKSCPRSASKPDHRHRPARAAGILAKVPEVQSHRRPRRLRRTGPRPDGPQPDRHLHRAQARDEWRKPDKAWLTDELRQVLAAFPAWLQLHPAHRHARLGNAHRRARRPGDQDLRPRSRHAQRPRHPRSTRARRCRGADVPSW
jgi:cobalt-zinc-cadmium resistance protein CzcA